MTPIDIIVRPGEIAMHAVQRYKKAGRLPESAYFSGLPCNIKGKVYAKTDHLTIGVCTLRGREHYAVLIDPDQLPPEWKSALTKPDWT